MKLQDSPVPQPLRVCALLLCVLTLLAAPVVAQECDGSSAEFIAVEGVVERNRPGSEAWVRVVRGDQLCAGDSVRVLDYSRAALRLQDGTVERLEQATSLRWVDDGNRDSSLIDVIRGVIQIISRDPRSLRFTTPFANAGLEGTEFLIAVSDTATEITVIEGVVQMTSSGREVRVGAGERGTSGSDGQPTVGPAPDISEFIAWALHYSPIWNLGAPDPDEEPSADRLDDPQFYAGRAARRLATGSIEAARADIAQALALDPDDADALALQAAVSAGLNDTDEAQRLADAALAVDPDSAPALLVLAETLQARFDMAHAREILVDAAAAHPDNAIVWARLAEVQLAMENQPAALEAARRATDLQPDLSHAHTVLGFSQLMNFDLDQAEASFETAISRDEAAPLPRLGLGLALIRQGQLEAGRREIEIAVLLDPNDAILRSYVAKAYFDERREPLSGMLLDLAKELDSTEPTPWLYDGLTKHATNRPVEAMRDLERASALNDEQGVLRSRLGIDEDIGVRSAAHAGTFRDLGFDQLALVEGWQSVLRAPDDYAGHRMLADSYSSQPRHQIARVNELFVSELLQPMNHTGIPAQLGESNLFVGEFLGADSLAFNEFNPLLTRNHLSVQGSGLVAGNGTRGDGLTVSGIDDRFSFSVGQFDFETDGLRENNDFDTTVRNAFVQFRPNAATSLLGEIRSTTTEKGDLQFLFDSERFNPLLRRSDDVDSLRLGFHRVHDERSEWLGAAQYYDGTSTADSGPSVSLNDQFNGYSYDMQNLRHLGRWSITSGFLLARKDVMKSDLLIGPLDVPPFQVEQTFVTATRVDQIGAYSYGHFRWTKTVTAIFGASLDALDGQTSDSRSFNPKLGLVWQPAPGTFLRAAAFRTLQGSLVSKEIIQPRLEPTQVAGFNQFFFGSEGDEATRVGIGIDRRRSSNVYYGAELSGRHIDSAAAVLGQGEDATRQSETDESLARTYVYWTPRDTLALTAELRQETIDNNGESQGEAYVRLHTMRLPIGLKYFRPGGFQAGFETTFVHQSGDFGEHVSTPSVVVDNISHDADSFWVADAFVGYRLPRRHGILSVRVQNLFDESFHFQDIDPENPSIMPKRLISLRFTLAL